MELNRGAFGKLPTLLLYFAKRVWEKGIVPNRF
jgi:hypothetical protein